MNRPNQQNSITASQLMIAMSEVFPDSTYGAIPIVDQRNALEAYLGCANGALAVNTEIVFPLETAVAMRSAA